MEKRRGAYSILVGRPRDRWWDDIKMDLQKWGGGIDWIDLADDRKSSEVLQNAVMNM